jgi:hypothetical protein
MEAELCDALAKQLALAEGAAGYDLVPYLASMLVEDADLLASPEAFQGSVQELLVGRRCGPTWRVVMDHVVNHTHVVSHTCSSISLSLSLFLSCTRVCVCA